jgi:site-specific DNA-methyltransferase (adenine-specific)
MTLSLLSLRPPFERIACMDAVAWLRTIDDESVDLVVTDIAYESLEKHRAKGTTTRLKVSDASSNEWFPIFENARIPELLRELYRVLKKNSHCYLYCDQETMFVFHALAPAAGFTWKKFLVWNKVSMGMGYTYRAQHELIVYLEKGKRKLRNLGVADVLEPSKEYDGPDQITEKRIRGAYPTEKPAWVSEVLITQSTELGELVIDPFMGSGSVGVAARRSGREFAGCDIKQSAVDFVRERLRPTEQGEKK